MSELKNGGFDWDEEYGTLPVETVDSPGLGLVRAAMSRSRKRIVDADVEIAHFEEKLLQAVKLRDQEKDALDELAKEEKLLVGYARLRRDGEVE